MDEKKTNSDSSNDIFRILRKELLDLVILPGAQILESAVCERFNISRPTVRTTFQRLSDLGLIEIVPYKGVFATLLNLDYIHEIILLRINIETKIVQDFIKAKPDSFLLEDIEHNIRKQKILIQQKHIDESAFYTLDSDMHRIWFNKQKCSGLWDLIQQQEVQYTRFRMLDFVATLKYQEIVDNHVEIFDAIKKRESGKIENLLGCHLTGGVRRMGNKIKSEYACYFDPMKNYEYWTEYQNRYYL